MRYRKRLAFLAAFMLLAIFVVATWINSEERANAAAERMRASVEATPVGAEVDLAVAFDLPWDRAVLMPAYAGPKEMNQILGFAGYGFGASSSNDESTQFLVFIREKTVVADMALFAGEDFKFGGSVERFSREDARFLVTLGPDGRQIYLERP